MAQAKPQTSKDDIQGYITHLTKVKTAQNKKTRYFTAQLETDKQKSTKIICFTPEKYDSFKTACESPEAFRFINAKIQPGRNNELEVKVFKDTDLVKVQKKLHFSKGYSSINKQEKEEKIFKLSELTEDFQMATVNVQYIETIQNDKPIMTRFGPRKITTIVVADATKSMKLVVWSDEILGKLQAGEFYSISSLRHRLYENGQLNTTSDTEVIPIPPFENVKADVKNICQERAIEVQIQSVQVMKKVSCSVCFKTFDANEYKQPLVRCSSCNYKVRTNTLPNQISVFAYSDIGGQQQKIHISPEAVEDLIHTENKPDLRDDTDAFEDFLILNKFQIRVSNENVVSKINKC